MFLRGYTTHATIHTRYQLLVHSGNCTALSRLIGYGCYTTDRKRQAEIDLIRNQLAHVSVNGNGQLGQLSQESDTDETFVSKLDKFRSEIHLNVSKAFELNTVEIMNYALVDVRLHFHPKSCSRHCAELKFLQPHINEIIPIAGRDTAATGEAQQTG